ncbi:MAG: hypothetical protein K2N72_13670 [Oscillospiraceae bacterium]|nr:hypothetical protein [Oscillospiraceae bacterium]
MSRKYIRLCTNHEKRTLSYPERFDICYLFHEEMQRKCGTYGIDYFDFILTEKNIEWIKKYYRLYDFTECYHDREPHIDLDYDDPDFDKVFNKLYRDGWYDRMRICNWCEPHQAGIWNYTDEFVEALGYQYIDKVRGLLSKRSIDVPYNKFEKNSDTYRIKLSFRNRMFTTLNRKKNDELFDIYWFGRDIEDVDYIWGFEKK